MVEKFVFSVEEVDCNLHCHISCSEMFNDMLKNGDIETLIHIFIDTVKRASEEAKCDPDQEMLNLMSEIFGE